MDGWLGGLQAGYSTRTGVWVFGFESDIQLTNQRSVSAFSGRTPDIPAIPEIPAIPGTPGTPGTPAIPCERIEGPNTPCRPGSVDIPAVPGTPAVPGVPGVPGVPAIPGVTGVANYRQELPWFATFRARLGVMATPTWLFYVTGGLVIGEITTNASFTTPTATVASRFSNIKAGFVVGGGTEWALSPNWSFKVEYLYIDFGRIDHSFPSILPFVGTFTASSRITDNIVRVGVSYRFGGPVGTN
jgi:opacity protein-like surface antigen